LSIKFGDVERRTVVTQLRQLHTNAIRMETMNRILIGWDSFIPKQLLDFYIIGNFTNKKRSVSEAENISVLKQKKKKNN
jgi:ABC-type xylose transport system substrate-binding protein